MYKARKESQRLQAGKRMYERKIYIYVCVYSILLFLLAESPCLLHSLLAGAKSHLLFVKPAGPVYVATRNRGSLYGRRCSLDQTPFFFLCCNRSVRFSIVKPQDEKHKEMLRYVAVRFRKKKNGAWKPSAPCRSCHVLGVLGRAAGVARDAAFLFLCRHWSFWSQSWLHGVPQGSTVSTMSHQDPQVFAGWVETGSKLAKEDRNAKSD